MNWYITVFTFLTVFLDIVNRITDNLNITLWKFVTFIDNWRNLFNLTVNVIVIINLDSNVRDFHNVRFEFIYSLLNSGNLTSVILDLLTFITWKNKHLIRFTVHQTNNNNESLTLDLNLIVITIQHLRTLRGVYSIENSFIFFLFSGSVKNGCTFTSSTENRNTLQTIFPRFDIDVVDILYCGTLWEVDCWTDWCIDIHL